MTRKILARLGAGAALLIAAAGAFASPAYAAGGADLSVNVASSKIAKDAPVKWFRVDLHNAGPDAAGDVVLRYDFSGLTASMVSVDLSAYEDFCDVTGQVVTCGPLPLEAGETWPDFVPVENAGAVGPAGSFTVEVFSTADDPNTANNTATVNVEVVPAGGDIQAIALDVVSGYDDSGKAIPVAPGDRAELVWALTNEGDRTIHGVNFTITLPPHVDLVNPPAVCDVEEGSATCSDPDAVIPPGGAYYTDEPMLVRVDHTASGPAVVEGGHLEGSAIELLSEPTEDLLSQKPAEGFAVEADASQADSLLADAAGEPSLEVDPGDNDASFAVHIAKNPGADLSISASEAEGAVGQKVDVVVSVTNHGPLTSGPYFTVSAPTGTVIVAADPHTEVGGCVDRSLEAGAEWSEAVKLSCTWESELPPDRTLTMTLTFRIDSADVGGNGKAKVFEVDDLDPNPANNTAPIVITVTGGSGGGTGGGLPVTGVQAGLIGGVGAAALGLGAVLFVLARRRRVVLVAPSDDRADT